MIVEYSNYQFVYSTSQSYEANFSDWYLLNSDERIAWGEKPYTREEAFEIFSNLFKNTVDNI